MAKSGHYWTLKRSSIHQKGMFAARDIPKGEPIIEYVGERIDKAESERRCLDQEAKGRKSGGAMVYVFDLNAEYDLDGNVPDNPAKYINHGCEENCEAVNEDDRIFIYAKRDIRKGDELLFDYGYDIEHWEDHPCRCGSPKCVGYIVAKSQRSELKKRLKAREKEQREAERAKKAEAAAAKKKERALLDRVKRAERDAGRARKAAERAAKKAATAAKTARKNRKGTAKRSSKQTRKQARK